MHGGKAKLLLLKREGNSFINGTIVEPIVFEDKEAIVLLKTYTGMSPYPPNTFAILIDKVKLNFVEIGLEFKNSTALIEGECKVSY